MTYMNIDGGNSVTRTIDRDGEMSGNTASSDTNANADEMMSVCRGMMDATMAETGSSSDDGLTQVVNILSGLSVKLTGLKPLTNYSVIVAANNSAGIGPPSEPLIVETDSELYNTTRGKILFLLNRSVKIDKCLFIECISQHLMDSGSWSDSYQLYTNLPQH